MANEILVLERQTLGVPGEDESFNFIFFFRLIPTIDVDGYVVVPTPSVNLPQLVLDAGILSSIELAALDNGTAAFVQSSPILKEKELTNGQYLARIQDLYRTRVDQEVQRLRDFYSFYGTQLDAE